MAMATTLRLHLIVENQTAFRPLCQAFSCQTDRLPVVTRDALPFSATRLPDGRKSARPSHTRRVDTNLATLRKPNRAAAVQECFLADEHSVRADGVFRTRPSKTDVIRLPGF